MLEQRSALKLLLKRSDIGVSPMLSQVSVVAGDRVKLDRNELAPVGANRFGVPGVKVPL
jgi:hypothetical protein